MKTKYFFSLLISNLLLFACTFSNKADSGFNLDFEIVKNEFPTGWKIENNASNYIISIDSINVYSGKYSVVIESKSDSTDFGTALCFSLPENYQGEEIKLSGYIKTENVDGRALLAIAINPWIARNILEDTISGTCDWKKYEVTAKLYPEMTKEITIAGALFGKGKIWLDNFKITIDGKDIQKAKIYNPEPFPAKKDEEFNKGSNIVFPELNEQKIDDLELLGRIWGFLKYHHPAVAKGNYNWDYELFRILSSYLKTNDNELRDRLLLKWINKYGKIPKCKGCQSALDSTFIKPDLSWIEKSDMNNDLKKKIQEIYSNRHQGENYYIKMVPSAGNPQFLNENPYNNMPYPDAGFRLLALYKYWNMIQYFFPDKYQTDKNWDDVLKEYIPIFILAKNELEYELAVTQLIGEVCDTHAGLWGGGDKIDSLKGDEQAPVQVQFIENKWVITDYYINAYPHFSNAEKVKETGLKIGDIITHIGGKPVEAIVDSIKKYYPASNEAARMRNIANDLLRSDQSVVYINYLSSNQPKQKRLLLTKRNNLYPYYTPKDTTTQCYKFISKDIGYITLKSIKDEDIPAIKETFKNTKGIIIDIRNYPSAFTPFTLAPYFVSKSTPFVKFTNGNVNNPGEFTFTSPLKIPKPKETYQGKLVVIVNENTQSSAEYQSMAFRVGNNTTIIGSQTAGADGNVSEIFLPGGLKTRISGIGVYYPDGRETQRIGIVPDIEVKPTIKGIREGRDEVLEKAIEIINNDK